MSKVPDENIENGQFLSSSNTQIINENRENGQFLSSSNTQVINENGHSASSSVTQVAIENDENEKSLPTSNTRAITRRKPRKPTRKEKLKVLLGILLMVLFEMVLPLILYYVLKDNIGDIKALIISGVPPFIVVIYGFIRNRRIDILGAITIIGSIVSAIVAALKDDPRLYLFRESLITGSIGLTFLITLIPFKYGSFKMRPIIFYFSKDMMTGGTFGSFSKKVDDETTSDIAERWDRYWDNYAVFRHGFYVLTIHWGIGLIIEVPIRAIVVFKAPTVERAFFWSSVAAYSWLAVLILFNTIYSRIFKKKCLREIPEDEESPSNETSV